MIDSELRNLMKYSMFLRSVNGECVEKIKASADLSFVVVLLMECSKNVVEY